MLPLGTRIRITNGALTLWGETGYLAKIEEDGEHGHILLKKPMYALEVVLTVCFCIFVVLLLTRRPPL